MTEVIDMRDAFFDEIGDRALADPNFVILTNDMDVHSLRKLQSKRPNQLINVGVAEQNLINVAAGLAATGQRVMVFGISSFLAFRAYEQIRINVAGMNLPVTIVGLGQGLSFSYDGPTHHGTHDLAVLRTIPELEILNPGDASMARASAKYALVATSPLYVRLDKGPYPVIYPPSQSLGYGFSELYPVAEVTVVATGSMVPMALDGVRALRNEGHLVGLIDITRVSPIPKTLGASLRHARNVIVVEDNSPFGGLYSAILESEPSIGKALEFLGSGMRDRQNFSYGSRSFLNRQEGLDSDSLRKRLLELLGKRAIIGDVD